MVGLRKLRLHGRQIKPLRDAWAGLRLIELCLRSTPDWVRWQWARRTRKGQDGQAYPDHLLRPLHIAFVTRYARAREFKLAYAARLYGHRVTLIAMHVQSQEMVTQYFAAYQQATSPGQVLTTLDRLQPDMTHLFVNYNNLEMLPVLLFAPSPVIYDPYDCIRGMFRTGSEPFPFELAAERVAFARADHICSRSLEPLCLRRRFGYSMPATTYFPEYCWHPSATRQPRVVSDGDELHVIYCGGVWPEDRYSEVDFGYAQYLEVGRALAEQRIHLHVYPAPTPENAKFDDFFSLYLAESERNSFFHIYRPLPYEALIGVLPQYDAAMHIMGVSINDNLGRATRAKLDYSTANKLFDYIQAGLPVIIHDGKHQRGVVRHYGAAVEITRIDHVRAALLGVLSTGHSMKPNPAIAVHAVRLDNMYRSLL